MGHGAGARHQRRGQARRSGAQQLSDRPTDAVSSPAWAHDPICTRRADDPQQRCTPTAKQGCPLVALMPQWRQDYPINRPHVIDAEQRSPILPNVPTSKEAGLPEFQVSAWNALFAPKGTPKAILNNLTDAFDKALDDQNVRKQLADLATEIPDKANRGQLPLASLVKSEITPLDADHQGGQH